MHSIILLALVCAAAAPSWKEVQFENKPLLLHQKCEALDTKLMGPFATRGDNAVVAVDSQHALISHDDGKTWESRPLFSDLKKYECRGERTLLRTRSGVLILAFLNSKELLFKWDQAKGGPQPGTRLPVYITRSVDEGETWEQPQLVQEGWCGALRTMIQLKSGRLVMGCQVAATDPGRNVCFSYASDDEGKTWKKSNVIDLGKYAGFGDHGGGIEPTLAELKDGRLWMLIRTYRGCFSEAFSSDGGLTWTDIRTSKIEASGSPGQLQRLQSGRLVLLWNRYIDKQQETGRREQLSMAFSEDDGRTWTEPFVVAYDAMKPGHKEQDHRLSYPYVYEHVPGELWITTMQGPLRIKLEEDDFFPRRLSQQTYQAKLLPSVEIKIDGIADEPEWTKATVESHFFFPWKEVTAPATEFRAVCDENNLYFTFRVRDDDVVVLEKLRNKKEAVFEDRVELYFCRDDRMKNYFCMEVDSRGRAFDYSGSYYRKLDPTWNCKGLETKASSLPNGYVVEGRIPLAAMQEMGLTALQPGAKVRWGLFRAEFSHDRNGKSLPQRPSLHNQGLKLDGPPPIEEWMSWVDPRTEVPDFHVPTSLGWLEIVK